jgi:hypothetical protein
MPFSILLTNVPATCPYKLVKVSASPVRQVDSINMIIPRQFVDMMWETLMQPLLPHFI